MAVNKIALIVALGVIVFIIICVVVYFVFFNKKTYTIQSLSRAEGGGGTYFDNTADPNGNSYLCNKGILNQPVITITSDSKSAGSKWFLIPAGEKDTYYIQSSEKVNGKNVFIAIVGGNDNGDINKYLNGKATSDSINIYQAPVLIEKNDKYKINMYKWVIEKTGTSYYISSLQRRKGGGTNPPNKDYSLVMYGDTQTTDIITRADYATLHCVLEGDTQFPLHPDFKWNISPSL